MTYAIELYITREPGVLSVADYQGDAHGDGLEGLDKAIAQVEAFTAALRAIRDDVAANGLGERLPTGPSDPHPGQTAADAFGAVFGSALGDTLFTRSAAFLAYKGKR